MCTLFTILLDSLELLVHLCNPSSETSQHLAKFSVFIFLKPSPSCLPKPSIALSTPFIPLNQGENLIAMGIQWSEMDGETIGGGWCDRQRWVVRERDGRGGRIYLAVYPVTAGLSWSTYSFSIVDERVD
ncbi:hypothetical protein L1887_14658 [Cichorium endivia]|nr:hypothetical protein L1887_14658 [Cichorium endivia]